MFNRLTGDPALMARLVGHELFVIHTQRDELKDTPDPRRRAELVRTLDVAAPEKRVSASSVWDVSYWDEACWSDVDGLYDALLAGIKERDKRSKRRVGQIRDALTAETAIQEALTLVTEDGVLRDVVTEHGGQAISFDQLCASGDGSA